MKLYDSVYRGYPIGSLLFQVGKAPAQQLKLGPLTVNAPEIESALWVVDGQQRLVSLAAGLARETPLPEGRPDPYVVYFDAEQEEFVSSKHRGTIPTTWVPVPKLRDSAALAEWVFEWDHGRDPELRRAVFEAAKRLREYVVPLYTVGTDDLEIVSQVFVRLNERGKDMKWGEIQKALYGGRRDEPTTLPELAEALSEVGMGTPDDRLIITAMLASQGLDVTQGRRGYLESRPEEMVQAADDALPAFRSALSLIRQQAEIPHLLLLPLPSLVISGLVRFFAEFPEPRARSRTLLARWVWRVSRGAFKTEPRTIQRSWVSAIHGDEEESVQRLLQLTPRNPDPYETPDKYITYSAEGRIAMLTLISAGPLDPQTRRPVDVLGLIESDNNVRFRRIWKIPGQPLADRLIADVPSPSATLLRNLPDDQRDEVLASHLIVGDARKAFLSGDADAFLAARSAEIERLARQLVERHTAWGRGDRPSIGSILSND